MRANCDFARTYFKKMPRIVPVLTMTIDHCDVVASQRCERSSTLRGLSQKNASQWSMCCRWHRLLLWLRVTEMLTISSRETMTCVIVNIAHHRMLTISTLREYWSSHRLVKLTIVLIIATLAHQKMLLLRRKLCRMRECYSMKFRSCLSHSQCNKSLRCWNDVDCDIDEKDFRCF